MLHIGALGSEELSDLCWSLILDPEGKLAEEAEFFSFGTNDLTQTTYGLSRDDTGTFMSDYKAN